MREHVNTYLDVSSTIGYKWMMTIGAIIGGGNGFLTRNGESIVLTFILGFVGAMAAGLAKLLIDRMKKKLKDKNKI